MISSCSRPHFLGPIQFEAVALIHGLSGLPTGGRASHRVTHSRTSFGLLVFGGLLTARWELLIIQRQQDLSSSTSSPLTGTSTVKLLVMKTKAGQTFPGFLFPSICRLPLTRFAGRSQAIPPAPPLSFWTRLRRIAIPTCFIRGRFPASIIWDTSPFRMPCFLRFSPCTFLSFFSLP